MLGCFLITFPYHKIRIINESCQFREKWFIIVGVCVKEFALLIGWHGISVLTAR